MAFRRLFCLSKNNSSASKDSGQTLLIILLVTAVILTIGLAVASYSITNIKISRYEEESARAFSAAEAGIEEALKLGSAPESGLVDIGDITAEVSETVQGGGTDFDFAGSKFESEELANIWLVGHTDEGALDPSTYFPAGGNITICWGDDTVIDDNTPAIEAALLYQDAGTFKVARGAFDPKADRGNGFDVADSTGGGNCGDLAFAEDLDLVADFGIPGGAIPYSLRLKLFYNPELEPIAVSASEDLPLQGKCYESQATIAESSVSRKVRQCQFYESPPGIFDYVLFSTGDLVK